MLGSLVLNFVCMGEWGSAGTGFNSLTCWSVNGFEAYFEGTEGFAERSSYFMQCWCVGFFFFLFIFFDRVLHVLISY